MSDFLAATPHTPLTEDMPDIFFVTGTREWHFMDMDWQFSRNMTVVRQNGELTIFNSIRLDEDGLAQLDSLGKVTNLVQVGGLHGVDDPFYKDRYGCPYWAQPGGGQAGMTVDKELKPGGEMPLDGMDIFSFETTNLPEAIIKLGRDGGVMIACDAMQNYLAPDEFFSEQSANVMTEMGFFTPCNVGPVWMQAAEPGAADFERLKKESYEHVYCGHGAPVHENAKANFDATFDKLFGLS